MGALVFKVEKQTTTVLCQFWHMDRFHSLECILDPLHLPTYFWAGFALEYLCLTSKYHSTHFGDNGENRKVNKSLVRTSCVGPDSVEFC